MRTLLPSLLLLVACGGDPAPALPDLTDPCAPIGRSEDGACVSSLAFAAGPALPRARDHHGTVIAETGGGAFLYVTGGTNYRGVFADAAVAPVLADGSLGAFSATTALPSGRAGHGVVAHGGRIFVVGGQGPGGFLATVSSAPVNADGTLGAWEDEPPLSAARFHIAVTATDTHVYAIGGVELIAPDQPFVATRDVWFASFQPDGHLSSWTHAPDLPEARSHHAIAAHDGRLFVVGGLTQDTTNGSPMAHVVLVSTLGPDGAPGPFAAGGTFDEPVATLALADVQGQLYAIGGLTEDDAYSDRVRRAPFLPDGTLGAFVDAGTLPAARSHVHQTPYRDGVLYTMGGSIDYQVVTDEVWVGRFAPPAMAPQALRRAPVRRGGARCPCSRIAIPR